jgi:SAF domain
MQYAPTRTVEVPTSRVVVAATDLQLGAELKSGDLRTIQLPSGAVPQGSFSNPEELLGRGLVLPVVQNEPTAPVVDNRSDIERAQDRAAARAKPVAAEAVQAEPVAAQPSARQAVDSSNDVTKQVDAEAVALAKEQRELLRAARAQAERDAKAADKARKEEAKRAAVAQAAQEKLAREQAKRDEEAAKAQAKRDAEAAKAQATRDAAAAREQQKRDAATARAQAEAKCASGR